MRLNIQTTILNEVLYPPTREANIGDLSVPLITGMLCLLPMQLKF